MAKLGDFIGAVLSDAVQARVRADMETLKIAEAYSSHDLLKYFPVPRFRLPEITVDFPVVVSSIESGADAGTKKFFIEPNTAEIQMTVRRAVAESGIRLSIDDRTKVCTALERRSKRVFKAGPQVLLSLQVVSSDFVRVASEALRGLRKADDLETEKLKTFESALSSSLRELLIAKMTQAPSLQVLVSSSDIKAHGDPDSLFRVRLSITEDGYEVVNRDEDGKGFVLTPE